MGFKDVRLGDVGLWDVGRKDAETQGRVGRGTWDVLVGRRWDGRTRGDKQTAPDFCAKCVKHILRWWIRLLKI